MILPNFVASRENKWFLCLVSSKAPFIVPWVPNPSLSQKFPRLRSLGLSLLWSFGHGSYLGWRWKWLLRGLSGGHFCFLVFDHHLEVSGNWSLFLSWACRTPNWGLRHPESSLPLTGLIFNLPLSPVTLFKCTSLSKELSWRYLVTSEHQSQWPRPRFLSWLYHYWGNWWLLEMMTLLMPINQWFSSWRLFWPLGTLDNVWRHLAWDLLLAPSG